MHAMSQCQKHYVAIHALLTVCLFSCLCLVITPAAAQSGSGTLPTDPFARLLYRLDHAPFDLDRLDASSERGSAMQQEGARYEAAMAPALPVLEAMSHSKTLHFLAKMPFIGDSFDIAQRSIDTAFGIGYGFSKLVDLDRHMLQPLREAVHAGAALRRSRRQSDLPETVEALDGAVLPLKTYETACKKQNRVVQKLISSLEAVRERSAAQHNEQATGTGRLTTALNKLNQISAGLTARTREIHGLRVYTEACAADAHAAEQIAQIARTR